MSDLLHALVERFGLVAVFLGCLAEGESAAIFGGFFAHQGVFDPWMTLAIAFSGAWLGDTALFLAGRRFADHPRVVRIRAKPGFRHAHDLIERHPDLFVLTNRFIYGLRTVGGIAAGLSGVQLGRFLVLNAISAAVWAMLFVGIGYFFGLGVEQLLGKALLEHERLIVGVGAAILVALGAWVVSRRLARRGQ